MLNPQHKHKHKHKHKHNPMKLHSKLIARFINLFTKHYLFSQEWRKGDGFKNWLYEHDIVESVQINVELLRLRGYELLTK